MIDIRYAYEVAIADIPWNIHLVRLYSGPPVIVQFCIPYLVIVEDHRIFFSGIEIIRLIQDRLSGIAIIFFVQKQLGAHPVVILLGLDKAELPEIAEIGSDEQVDRLRSALPGSEIDIRILCFIQPRWLANLMPGKRCRAP